LELQTLADSVHVCVRVLFQRVALIVLRFSRRIALFLWLTDFSGGAVDTNFTFRFTLL
jgi:hypothetical protein